MVPDRKGAVLVDDGSAERLDKNKRGDVEVAISEFFNDHADGDAARIHSAVLAWQIHADKSQSAHRLQKLAIHDALPLAMLIFRQ